MQSTEPKTRTFHANQCIGAKKSVTGFALVVGLPKTLPERKWEMGNVCNSVGINTGFAFLNVWGAIEIKFPRLLKLGLTYSPPSVVITSASGGSLRVNVTVATVCRALMSTVIFHGVEPDGVASKMRIPLLTRALQINVSWYLTEILSKSFIHSLIDTLKTSHLRLS